MQERGQRVDVGCHPRHDGTRAIGLEVVNAKRLQVTVAAHTQGIEQPLTSARSNNSICGYGKPTDEDRRQATCGAGPQHGLIVLTDAVVNGVAHEHGERQIGNGNEGEQRDDTYK